jgi:SAM-dependent methyltransferase
MFDRFVTLPREGQYRILDFGCGQGHSTEVLLGRFPNARIVAVDLAPVLADYRKRVGNHPRVDIVPMEGSVLPALGDGYDVIQLNAVFEHLLPGERRELMPGLWRRLARDGYLIVMETPWRWFPIETHCTSLPLVNYLPDRLALAAFRHCGRFSRSASMEAALRDGLRGATVAEIEASLDAPVGTLQRVSTDASDARDLLEVWWHGECRQSRQRALAYQLLAFLRRTTGLVISPWINVVFRKRAGCREDS